MSGINLDNGGDKGGRIPSIREAAQALCDSHRATPGPVHPAMIDAWVALEAALSQPERSRPDVIPDMALAQEAIGIIKAKRPGITAQHVDALVSLAELGLDELASFNMRWEADMRAIKRWRDGGPEPYVAELMTAGQAMREMIATNGLAGGKDWDEAVHHARLVRGDRVLIWPDHADLVVWLLELLELPSEFPAIAEVARMTGELRTRVDIASGQVTPLRRAAADMIVHLADGLRYSERSRFAAGTKYAGAMDLLADAGLVLRDLAPQFRGRTMDVTASVRAEVCDKLASRIESVLGLDAANDRAGS